MNIKKMSEEKVLRDPIHGYIHVIYQIVLDCINAREFQRLKRIRQLGGTFQVYSTSDHTRFSHSLGVYEIVRRLTSEVKSIKNAMSEYEIVCTLLAALLHDLGHGPYSHIFEEITGQYHEKWTFEIITGDTEIHQILDSYSPKIVGDVIEILKHVHYNPICNQLVSGQIDADRMDYLLRDSYFTGTTYGKFDIERIIRILDVKEDQLVVKESGVYAIEDYILSRYYMYGQIYYHPVAIAFDGMLVLLFQRMKDAYQEGILNVDKYPMFKAFIGKQEITYNDILNLDDHALNYGISLLMDSEDSILRDLAYRLHYRKLFTYSSQEEGFDVETYIEKIGYDPRYFIYKSSALNLPYHIGKDDEILVVCRDGVVKELSTVSLVVKSILFSDMKEDKKIFYPKEKLVYFKIGEGK